MKRNAPFLRLLTVTFAALLICFLQTNPSFAQCGNYFKTNYQAPTPISDGVFGGNTNEGLDDWTGDGRSDFWNFRRNPTTFVLSLVIYPAKTTGYWDWDNPIIYTTPFNNFGGEYRVADFDSDGKMDLYFDKRIYHNTGSNLLIAYPIFTDTGLSSSPTIGFEDLNGDNLLDWIYTAFNSGVGEIRYQLQNPDGSFGTKTTILAGTAQNGASSSVKRLGDFNGDGKTDIIYGGVVGGASVYGLIKNLGNGNFQVGAPVATDLYVYIAPIYSNPVRDFNNDGKDDILSQSAIFYGQADGTFIRAAIPTTTNPLLAAELNGDNNPDYIEFGTTSYTTSINNGAGGFTRTVYPGSLNQFEVLFEDFNGDGKDDYFSKSLLPVAFPIIDKNIFGERVISVKGNVCQPFGETKMANFDGNVNADLTVWNPASGNWSSKNAKWTAPLDPTVNVFNWGLGSFGDVPAPGDFDGDGKTDYSIYRSSTGEWYALLSANSAWSVIRFGLSGDVAVPNDYNGGGKTDLAVFRPSDGNWHIWFGETQTYGVAHFGASGDKPVPADYDGDGKTDIAVFRPSDGNWYILRSTDFGYSVLHWGVSTDVPVPADYDGDGKADVTIYRSGFWWILRSSNNSYSVAQWGQPGDIPLPVYRNSVSADLILYRPSNNSWHSSDNRSVPGIVLGGSQDVPVFFGLPNN